MNLKLCYIFIALYSLSSSKLLSGQTNVDSLWSTADSIQIDSQRIDYLLETAWSFRNSETITAIRLLQKLTSTRFYKNVFTYPDKADYYLGELYHLNGDIDLAESKLLDYYNYWKDHNEYGNMGASQYKLSDIYRTKNDYEKGLQAAYLPKEAFEAGQNEEWSMNASTLVAQVLNKMGRPKEALDQFRVLKSKATGSPELLAQVYNGMSVIFDDIEMVDSALHYQVLYKNMVLQTDNYANQFIAVYNLSLTLQNLKRHDDALKSFDECLALAKKSGVPMLLPYGLISKGGLYTELGKPNKAISLFKEAENSSLLPDQQQLILQGKYEAYKKMGNDLGALDNLERWKIFSDSLQSIEITNRVNEMQIKYESTKKESRISALSLQNEIQSHSVKTQRWGLLGLSTGLLILGAFLYFTLRQRNKIKEQKDIISSALAEKDILLKEIHHRVKNNLQIVSSLLSMQSSTLEDSAASAALEEGQNRVYSMALIHQHLYADDRMAGVQMEKYISNLCQATFKAYNIDAERIQLNLNIEELELDIKTAVPLALVLNELITNACKYAFPEGRKGTVEVSLAEKNQQLFVSVNDNGIGIAKDAKSTGFGTVLINAFAKKMQAEIIRESEGGTHVQLIINNYEKIMTTHRA